MQLPLSLRTAIEQEILKMGAGPLTKAAAELSERYRRQTRPEGQFITGEAQRLAYLAVRMPATFAAAHAVLSEVRRLAAGWRIESLLDLGAGTGTASWAAAEVFPELQRCALVEQDRHLIEL